MVAMPFILVSIVSNLLSVLFFSLTTAALLSKYPVTTLPLLKRHRAVVFVTYSLVLAGLLSLGVYFTDALRNVHIGPVFIFEILFSIAFANSLILAYQFLRRRLFLHMPEVRRRLLLAFCSLVMVSVPVFAVMTAVVQLFVIR